MFNMFMSESTFMPIDPTDTEIFNSIPYARSQEISKNNRIHCLGRTNVLSIQKLRYFHPDQSGRSRDLATNIDILRLIHESG